jgi:pimeloyl-ACP methyl ester carboxylesterase
MDFYSELRYPTKWYSKLSVAAIAILFFWFLSTTTISLFLLYRIISPTRSAIEISVGNFPGRPEEFTFAVPGGSQRVGWFFPGLRNAPTIILCHGYASSRGELLTLATSLQDRQYNVFMFDFGGHGTNKGYSTMGYEEVGELSAAIDALVKRDDVNPDSFGLWGINLGAYAALAVAEKNPRIRAVVLESAYERPGDFLKLQVERSGLSRIPFLETMAAHAFGWLHRKDSKIPPLSRDLSRTNGMYKLFLEAPEEPALARETRALFLASPEPKQDAVIAQGNYARMADDARHNYENRVLSFFLLNLPATNGGR